MATYEAYLGGLVQQNANLAKFPAAPFNQAVFIQPAVRQKPIRKFVARDLNFGLEPGLKTFVTSVNLASGDKLGSVIIPNNFLAQGFYWKVAGINAGGTFSVATRVGGTSLLTATTTGTAASGYVTWPSGPVLFALPDIIDVTFATVPAGGLGTLDLVIGVVGDDLRYGNW